MKRRGKYLLAVAATAVALAASATIGTPIAKAQAPPAQQAQPRGASSLCLNRQGGGQTYSTHILGWSCNDPSDNFERRQLTGMCNGGWVTSTCPFTDHQIDQHYLDSAIIREQTYDPLRGCVASGQLAKPAFLDVCPGLNGLGGGWGTVQVLAQVKCCDFLTNGAKKSYVVNVHWTNEFDSARWQCVYTRGNQVDMGHAVGDAGYCEWYEAYS